MSPNLSHSGTPEVNFIIILRGAFMRADPESPKRHSSCQSFLRFWDLRAQKLLLMKLTPGNLT